MEIRREKKHAHKALIVFSIFGILAILTLWILQLRATYSQEGLAEARATMESDTELVNEGVQYAEELKKSIPYADMSFQEFLKSFEALMQGNTAYNNAFDAVSKSLMESINTPATPEGSTEPTPSETPETTPVPPASEETQPRDQSTEQPYAEEETTP